jgi:hypothetical protein
MPSDSLTEHLTYLVPFPAVALPATCPELLTLCPPLPFKTNSKNRHTYGDKGRVAQRQDRTGQQQLVAGS